MCGIADFCDHVSYQKQDQSHHLERLENKKKGRKEKWRKEQKNHVNNVEVDEQNTNVIEEKNCVMDTATSRRQYSFD